MAWRVYSIIPIDFGWERLQTVEEVAANMAEEKAAGIVHAQPSYSDLEKFFSDIQRARSLAEEAGWEGDYRDRPRVFWLPDENDFSCGFVWKQDNNGTTYVVSPHPLPWLDALG